MTGTGAGAPRPRRHWRTPRTVLAALALQWRVAPLASAVLLGLTVSVGVLPATTAWLTKLLLDELGRGGAADRGRAVGLAVAATAAGGLQLLVLRLTGYLTQVVRQEITVAVAQRLFAKVIRFGGLRYFEDPTFHDELQGAEQAATEAPQAVATFAQEALRCLLTLASYAGVLWAVSPPVTLVLLAVGAVALLAQLAQTGRQARVFQLTIRFLRRQLFYRELLTQPQAAKEIRLFGLGELLVRRMVRSLREAGRVQLAADLRSSLIQAGIGLVSSATTAFGVVIVVSGAVQGRLTVGDVPLFLAAVAGMQSAFTGIVTQAGAASRGTRLFGRYLDVLAAPDDLPPGTRSVGPLGGSIELRDVWFRYHRLSPWVLRGVDLTLPAGAVVGLVGRNGAGKSTLVKLLCRFYDPQRGSIVWDGTDLRELDLAQLRRRIAVTFQDYMTYDLTAAENIGLGEPRYAGDQDRVRRAARLAGIDDTLAGLPDGYQTLLSRIHHEDGSDGQPGTTLSGGQWQRVALARTLIREQADLLVLDEPSAGLDPEAEYRLHRTLHEHGRGRTRLLVSHRLSALRDADTLVVLRDGQIIEQGSHDELMRADGEYRRLFSLQARGYQDERVDSGATG